MIVTGKIVRVYNEVNPEKIKWNELPVDYVIESTGRFTDVKAAKVNAISYTVH